MSCTIVALPFALAWIAGRVAATAVPTIMAMKNQMDHDELNQEEIPMVETQEFIHKYHAGEIPNICENECDDVRIISGINLKDYKIDTPFTDKDILIKTLEEHGAKDLLEEQDRISCRISTYYLVFEKHFDKTFYTVTINCLETDNINTKLEDINSEYALNVQEENYLNLIEKIKENNMEIENEEVLEDNTIVLTINLE